MKNTLIQSRHNMVQFRRDLRGVVGAHATSMTRSPEGTSVPPTPADNNHDGWVYELEVTWNEGSSLLRFKVSEAHIIHMPGYELLGPTWESEGLSPKWIFVDDYWFTWDEALRYIAYGDDFINARRAA